MTSDNDYLKYLIDVVDDTKDDKLIYELKNLIMEGDNLTKELGIIISKIDSSKKYKVNIKIIKRE